MNKKVGETFKTSSKIGKIKDKLSYVRSYLSSITH